MVHVSIGKGREQKRRQERSEHRVTLPKGTCTHRHTYTCAHTHTSYTHVRTQPHILLLAHTHTHTHTEAENQLWLRRKSLNFKENQGDARFPSGS